MALRDSLSHDVLYGGFVHTIQAVDVDEKQDVRKFAML